MEIAVHREYRWNRRNVPGMVLLIFAALAAAPALAQTERQAGIVRDPAFRMAKPVMSWKQMKNRHVVMQQRDYSCGAAALATLMRYYWGHDVSEADVLVVVERMLDAEQLRDRVENGLTMADLEEAARRMGYQSVVGQVTFEELKGSKVPVIVVVNLGGLNHFVVYRDDACGSVFLADPLRGNTRLSAEGFQQVWQRNAILVVAPPGQTSSERSQLGLTSADLHTGYLNKQVILRAATNGMSFLK
ncbi:MAG: hypothetical protein D6753_10235 [Planctomycetota bacterium]|nr:MAG: hypothetical protein D6753_10235 [Planctomycetota bacterium]